jgi:hypothetical protein
MSPCCSYWDEDEDRADVVKAQRAKTLQDLVKAGMGPQSELALATGGSDGGTPFGGVIFDSAGNLYDTTGPHKG